MGGVGHDERQTHVCLGQTIRLALGSLSQSLHGEIVAREVNAYLLLELVHEVTQQLLVKVLAAEQRVTLVDLTTNTPPDTSRIDTSKVPPPRSNTAMNSPSVLSIQ